MPTTPRDPHRPLYHFTAGNWMNDPIPFFHDGVYHIFFQHNPARAHWGNMHWGHATSRDLVHWQQIPIALAPTPGSPDADGCWTGSVVEHPHPLGRFHIFYTGIPKMQKDFPQVQCLASSDDLVTWRKYEGNPVIPGPPPGFGHCFRDPNVWREDDAWLMMIGGEQADARGGAAHLYRSADFLTWEYLHPLVLGAINQTAFDFECPDFFALTTPSGVTKHVLLTSRHRVHYQVGAYSGRRFSPERFGQCDVGGIHEPAFPKFPAYYAAKTMRDAADRRLLFGWITEERDEATRVAAGWAGALSLPRILGVTDDERLTFTLPTELEALRQNERRAQAMLLPAGTHVLPGITGDALELHLRIKRPTKPLTIAVRATADLAEKTELVYDPAAQMLSGVPLELPPDAPLELRIFIDRSIVEAFANQLACVTQRTYPTRPQDAVHVAVASDEAVQIDSLASWAMVP